MDRIRQSADCQAQSDSCSDGGYSSFESSFQVDSAMFSPATNDWPQAVFAPLHYEARYAYPLIVWLHGPGGDQRQLLRIMPVVSLRNYLAVAPQGILTQPDEKYKWEQTPAQIDHAEQRIFDCIESVSERYNFSRHRIFLAGFDSGGTMAFRVAMNNPAKFAGAISLCGPFPHGQNPFGNFSSVRRLPIFLAAGRKSKTYAESQVCADLRLLHSAGIAVTLRQYPCAQELAPQMLQDMDRWIIEQITASSRSATEA